MTHPLHKYSDIHSHDLSQALTGRTVVNITPADSILPGGTYSVGIHPWETDHPVGLGILRKLVAMARDPHVVAIGEAGFDRLRGGDMATQAAVFRFQAQLASRLGKPLIIHCVRAYDLLLAEARRLKPAPGMWIVHGFNRNETLALQLLDAGIDLSMTAERLNSPRYAALPPARLHPETDSPNP